MAGFNFGEGMRTIFLAGVGAIAMGAEKSQQIIDDLVKKGELTVEQGKELNEELTRKATKAKNNTQDAFLRTRLARGAHRLRREGRRNQQGDRRARYDRRR